VEPVTDSQGRELTESMHRSTGSYELVISPVLLALIGYGLDRWFGTVPVLTIIFAVVGLAGACVKLYYGYKNEMDEHEAKAPWAKQS
jgi:F0F1-type ATP synthase assembly protein I